MAKMVYLKLKMLTLVSINIGCYLLISINKKL